MAEVPRPVVSVPGKGAAPPKERKDLTPKIWAASGVLVVVFVVLAILDGLQEQTGVKVIPFEPVDWGIFALLAMIGPYGFYKAAQESRIKQIEKRLPDFLRDVAEAGRFGMTLADAIVVASSGRYGLLTPEIKKMAAQIDWGVPAGEAIRLFSQRVDTPLVNRMGSIIIKASDAGGNVADVLTMVSHDSRETILTQEERRITMSTYLAVIYIAYFVFIVTIVIMNATFIPKIEQAARTVNEQAEGLGAALPITLKVEAIPQVQLAFLLSVLVHAVGDGILAGVLQSGSIPNGMRHAFIMTLAGFLVLRVLAPT